ncbi:MAG: Trk system potassium transporter TrkA [Acidaminococcales bacterium]|jgi:trk system potassium uptake protein TrkA|nr:Trk system potassium transporter TrkA [Acidaminococcales bacterium]
MRVVIVGAGKLGYSLAEYLTKEQHEVVVVESDESHREIIKNNLDILTIAGNGASPSVLTDPDVKGADVLIACTYSDEVNMIICMMAKKVGVKQTVARIRSNEYTGEADNFIRDVTDIDLVLNPERIIALEILRLLLTPFTIDVGNFADGQVKIFECRISENSPLANKQLRELGLPKGILVTGILRKNKLTIPRGGDAILPGDLIFCIGLLGVVEDFEKFLGVSLSKIDRVLLIGAGRVGRYLAPLLENQGISVKIIDKNMERCEQITALLKNGLVICGDGTNIELLTQEGVAEADIVICLTEDDKLNLLLALLAKHLGAKKTVVKTAYTEYAGLMEEVGAGTVVSTRLLSVGEVLRFIRRGDVLGVSIFEGAKAEAIEMVIDALSPLAGIPLRNANLSSRCLVCAVVHEKTALIPHGNTVLYPGDRAILFVEFDAVNEVLASLKGK